jgi:hypothetical protein
MSYSEFVFSGYTFDKNSKTLDLNYSYSGGPSFSEKYKFDLDLVNYDELMLDRALKQLHLIAGVSYFKAYMPSDLVINYELSSSEAAFYSKTYSKGLGEFFYVNKLDPNTEIVFSPSVSTLQPISSNQEGLLIGIGGGKDSLVVVEALMASGKKITTWSLNHKTQLEPLINTIGEKHIYVERVIDPKLLELNGDGVLNGHIPISAIIAAVGVVVAILSGNQDVIVGNEATADEPTLNYQGVDINHQYSKTSEFERDYQALLKESFGGSLRFYSFLRPISELYTAEIFSKIGFNKYKGVFSSCNRAYTLHSDHMFWCGECPKCAFIFLILTPFISREELVSLWGGKNLLLAPDLRTTYLNLLGIDGDKPLDCVGEVKESRAAMQKAFSVYPELKDVYSFYLPSDYDYKALGQSLMPEDILALFNSFTANF